MELREFGVSSVGFNVLIVLRGRHETFWMLLLSTGVPYV